MSGGGLFDPMTPPERTSVAWERTAFSGMVVGLPAVAAVGIGTTMATALAAGPAVIAAAVG